MSGMLSYLKPDFVINNRYRITRRIGIGGFAVVFEAMDQQIDRLVAVKVLNTARFVQEEEVQAQLLERFEREAKLAAKVQHPNVMSVYDFGVVNEEKDPFIVMELLSGYDLEAQLNKHGAMAPSHIIPLFVDCLNALGIAHELGIVHKDLKPSNLFLKNPGERFETLCIVDFGIAHINEAFRKRLTQAGQILGTPDYLAPEYITEQVVSAALDVYQMGLILTEALMGEPVVQHPDKLVAMLMHVRGEIKVPSALIASPLGPVLQKALAYEPTSRYANGLEFADALAALDLKAIPAIDKDSPRELIAVPQDGGLGGPSKPPVTNSSEFDDDLQDPEAPTEFAPLDPDDIQDIAAASTSKKSSTAGLPKSSGESASKPQGDTADLRNQTNQTGSSEEFPAFVRPDSGNAKGNNKTLALVAVIIALLAVGGGAFVFMGSETAETNSLPVVSEAIVQEPPPVVEDIIEEPEVEEIEEVPQIVEVRLMTDPIAVSVYDGNTQVGTTPLTLTFNEGDEAVRKLRLEREGFRQSEIEVSAARALN